MKEALKKAMSGTGEDSDDGLADEGTHALVYQAKTGNWDEVMKMVASGKIPLQIVHELYLASAEFGHEELLRILLPRVPNMECVNDNGQGALTLASCNGHVTLVAMLLRANCNMESECHQGYTPLLAAVQCNQFQSACYLIEHKAHVHATSIYNYCALHIAAQAGSPDLVALLLDAKACANSLTADDYSPLEIAKNTEVCRIILERYCVHNGWEEKKNGAIDPQTVSPFRDLPPGPASYLFWTAMGVGKDSFMFQNFGVYPFDRLNDTERIIVLTEVAEGMSGYKSNIRPNILNESALYAVFALMKARIDKELSERVPQEDEVAHQTHFLDGGHVPQLDSDIEECFLWRKRVLAAFEQVYNTSASLVGLSAECWRACVWDTVINILARSLFGESFWEKKTLFLSPNSMERASVPRQFALDDSYFTCKLPSSASMEIQLTFKKLITMSKSFLCDEPVRPTGCFCQDCIAELELPLNFKLQFLEEAAEEKRKNKKGKKGAKDRCLETAESGQNYRRKLHALIMNHRKELGIYWSSISLEERWCLAEMSTTELADIIAASPHWETLRAGLESYAQYEWEEDVLEITEDYITVADEICEERGIGDMLDTMLNAVELHVKTQQEMERLSSLGTGAFSHVSEEEWDKKGRQMLENLILSEFACKVAAQYLVKKEESRAQQIALELELELLKEEQQMTRQAERKAAKRKRAKKKKRAQRKQKKEQELLESQNSADAAGPPRGSEVEKSAVIGSKDGGNSAKNAKDSIAIAGGGKGNCESEASKKEDRKDEKRTKKAANAEKGGTSTASKSKAKDSKVNPRDSGSTGGSGPANGSKEGQCSNVDSEGVGTACKKKKRGEGSSAGYPGESSGDSRSGEKDGLQQIHKRVQSMVGLGPGGSSNPFAMLNPEVKAQSPSKPDSCSEKGKQSLSSASATDSTNPSGSGSRKSRKSRSRSSVVNPPLSEPCQSALSSSSARSSKSNSVNNTTISVASSSDTLAVATSATSSKRFSAETRVLPSDSKAVSAAAYSSSSTATSNKGAGSNKAATNCAVAPLTGWDRFEEGLIFWVSGRKALRDSLERRAISLPPQHLRLARHVRTPDKPAGSTAVFIYSAKDHALHGILEATRAVTPEPKRGGKRGIAHVEFRMIAKKLEPVGDAAVRGMFSDGTRVHRLEKRRLRELITLFLRRNNSMPSTKPPVVAPARAAALKGIPDTGTGAVKSGPTIIPAGVSVSASMNVWKAAKAAKAKAKQMILQKRHETQTRSSGASTRGSGSASGGIQEGNAESGSKSFQQIGSVPLNPRRSSVPELPAARAMTFKERGHQLQQEQIQQHRPPQLSTSHQRIGGGGNAVHLRQRHQGMPPSGVNPVAALVSASSPNATAQLPHQHQHQRQPTQIGHRTASPSPTAPPYHHGSHARASATTALQHQQQARMVNAAAAATWGNNANPLPPFTPNQHQQHQYHMPHFLMQHQAHSNHLTSQMHALIGSVTQGASSATSATTTPATTPPKRHLASPPPFQNQSHLLGRQSQMPPGPHQFELQHQHPLPHRHYHSLSLPMQHRRHGFPPRPPGSAWQQQQQQQAASRQGDGAAGKDATTGSPGRNVKEGGSMLASHGALLGVAQPRWREQQEEQQWGGAGTWSGQQKFLLAQHHPSQPLPMHPRSAYAMESGVSTIPGKGASAQQADPHHSHAQLLRHVARMGTLPNLPPKYYQGGDRQEEGGVSESAVGSDSLLVSDGKMDGGLTVLHQVQRQFPPMQHQHQHQMLMTSKQEQQASSSMKRSNTLSMSSSTHHHPPQSPPHQALSMHYALHPSGFHSPTRPSSQKRSAEATGNTNLAIPSNLFQKGVYASEDQEQHYQPMQRDGAGTSSDEGILSTACALSQFASAPLISQLQKCNASKPSNVLLPGGNNSSIWANSSGKIHAFPSFTSETDLDDAENGWSEFSSRLNVDHQHPMQSRHGFTSFGEAAKGSGPETAASSTTPHDVTANQDGSGTGSGLLRIIGDRKVPLGKASAVSVGVSGSHSNPRGPLNSPGLGLRAFSSPSALLPGDKGTSKKTTSYKPLGGLSVLGGGLGGGIWDRSNSSVRGWGVSELKVSSSSGTANPPERGKSVALGGSSSPNENFFNRSDGSSVLPGVDARDSKKSSWATSSLMESMGPTKIHDDLSMDRL